MNEQNKIDNLFKEATQSYSASTPSGAWDRIETSLIAKRRRRRWIIWFFIFGFGIISAGGLLYNIDFNSGSKSLYTEGKRTDSRLNTNTSSIKKTTVEESQVFDNSNAKGIGTDRQPKEDEISESKPNAIISDGKKQSAKRVKSEKTVSIVDKQMQPISSVKQTEKKIEHEEVSIKSTITPNNTALASNKGTEFSSSNENKLNNDSSNFHTIKTSFPIRAFAIIINDSIENAIINESSSDSLRLDTVYTHFADPFASEPIKKATGLFISAYTGVSISNGIASESNSSYPTTAKSTITGAGTSSNIGLNIGYLVNKHFYISLGIKRYNLSIKGDFSLPDDKVNYVRMDQFGNTPMGYYSVSNLNAVIKTKNYSTVDYLRSFTKTKMHIHLFEIPLNVGYRFFYKKMRFSPHIGFNTSFILKNEVKISDGSGTELDGEIQNLKSRIFGVSGGLDITYRPGFRYSFGLRTDYTHFLGSISSSESYSFTPYSYTISPKVTIWF